MNEKNLQKNLNCWKITNIILFFISLIDAAVKAGTSVVNVDFDLRDNERA